MDEARKLALSMALEWARTWPAGGVEHESVVYAAEQFFTFLTRDDGLAAPTNKVNNNSPLLEAMRAQYQTLKWPPSQ